jgi:hypothetical protein
LPRLPKITKNGYKYTKKMRGRCLLLARSSSSTNIYGAKQVPELLLGD